MILLSPVSDVECYPVIGVAPGVNEGRNEGVVTKDRSWQRSLGTILNIAASDV